MCICLTTCLVLPHATVPRMLMPHVWSSWRDFQLLRRCLGTIYHNKEAQPLACLQRLNSQFPAMSSTKYPASEDIVPQSTEQTPPNQEAQPLALPAIPSEDEAKKLDVNSGNAVKLDQLGPMVVNSDGTLSRIANWAEMTEGERERTIKVLSKRNQIRMATLKSQEEQN